MGIRLSLRTKRKSFALQVRGQVETPSRTLITRSYSAAISQERHESSGRNDQIDKK